MAPPPKFYSFKSISQTRNYQNKRGVCNTKILQSPLSSSATLLCQINSTPGSFLKGISSLRRELYPPVRRNPPETRFPFEFPVSVCTPFVRESDGDLVRGGGGGGVAARSKIQFSSEGNNKFSFCRAKDEHGEHFNSPKRLDFVLRGMFIWSHKKLNQERERERESASPASQSIKCLFGARRKLGSINFKENLIDPSNINGRINNWCACCAGRVSHATRTPNGSHGARKNTGFSGSRDYPEMGSGKSAQFAFRWWWAILCIFKFVIAELSPGTGKFHTIKVREKWMGHSDKDFWHPTFSETGPWFPFFSLKQNWRAFVKNFWLDSCGRFWNWG